MSKKKVQKQVSEKLVIEYVPLSSLRHADYNPRVINDGTKAPVRVSIEKHGMREPLIVNRAKGRERIIVGGNLRAEVCKDMGIAEVPVVWVDIPDIEQEKDLCARLNKAVGEWDKILLAALGEPFLADVGFSSEEIDDIIGVDENSEMFDLQKELRKLGIKKVDIKPGDTFEIGDLLRVRCGDSMVEKDGVALMSGEKCDLVLTDPPYLLDYLKGKTKQKDGVTRGFGAKKNRVYLGTESLPDNFTDLWMASVAKVQKPDFTIMIFEHPKNLRTIWDALEKHWKYRNTVVWHVPNRVQGFSAKYKLFNKHDIALLGSSGDVTPNFEPESDELLQNAYENALLATSGKPHWESYKKGKKYQPTDFVSHVAADEKHSGQGVIFGTKPVDLLLPYMKVFSKRGDLVLECFGGSGSTAVTAWILKRRCFVMEQSPLYTAVILARLSKLTGLAPKKV